MKIIYENPDILKSAKQLGIDEVNLSLTTVYKKHVYAHSASCLFDDWSLISQRLSRTTFVTDAIQELCLKFGIEDYVIHDIAGVVDTSFLKSIRDINIGIFALKVDPLKFVDMAWIPFKDLGKHPLLASAQSYLKYIKEQAKTFIEWPHLLALQDTIKQQSEESHAVAVVPDMAAAIAPAVAESPTVPDIDDNRIVVFSDDDSDAMDVELANLLPL